MYFRNCGERYTHTYAHTHTYLYMHRHEKDKTRQKDEGGERWVSTARRGGEREIERGRKRQRGADTAFRKRNTWRVTPSVDSVQLQTLLIS